jgi:hypothetical protein
MTAMRPPSRPGNPQADLTREICEFLLEEARAVARQSVDRLRVLNDRYPSDFLSDLLAHPHTSSPSALRAGEVGPATERRQAQRFPSRGEAVRIATFGSHWGSYDGLLLNQSWQGLLLLCPEPLEVASLLAVYPLDTTRGLPRWAEVRYCLRRDDGWAIGSQRVIL